MQACAAGVLPVTEILTMSIRCMPKARFEPIAFTFFRAGQVDTSMLRRRCETRRSTKSGTHPYHTGRTQSRAGRARPAGCNFLFPAERPYQLSFSRRSVAGLLYPTTLIFVSSPQSGCNVTRHRFSGAVWLIGALLLGGTHVLAMPSAMDGAHPVSIHTTSAPTELAQAQPAQAPTPSPAPAAADEPLGN